MSWLIASIDLNQRTTKQDTLKTLENRKLRHYRLMGNKFKRVIESIIWVNLK